MAVAAEWKTDEEGGGYGQQAATPKSSSENPENWAEALGPGYRRTSCGWTGECHI